MEPIKITPISPKRRKGLPLALIVCGGVTAGILAIGGVMLLLSSMAEQRVKDASDRLRNLVLTIHFYHERNKELPNGIISSRSPVTIQNGLKGGERFSWRVQLLPFMHRQDLYDRFNFEEPWDSEHNLRVAQEMPREFRSRWDSKMSNHTGFVAIADPEGAFPTRNPARPNHSPFRSFGDFTRDGMRTLAVVEVRNSGIIWTDPDGDITIDQFVKLVEQGKLDPPGKAEVDNTLLVGSMDGSVHFLPRTVSAKTARAMCTRAGGEELTEKDFQ